MCGGTGWQILRTTPHGIAWAATPVLEGVDIEGDRPVVTHHCCSGAVHMHRLAQPCELRLHRRQTRVENGVPFEPDGAELAPGFEGEVSECLTAQPYVEVVRQLVQLLATLRWRAPLAA
eukprot:6938521-Prymnesium_polylepis.1